MTDRELLELAAKAAGYTYCRMCDNEADGALLFGVPEPWNPLNDDGDALRLAVKLGQAKLLSLVVGIGGADCEFLRVCRYAHERHDDGGDPYASTRRAITRAAAEIGKEMP